MTVTVHAVGRGGHYRSVSMSAISQDLPAAAVVSLRPERQPTAGLTKDNSPFGAKKHIGGPLLSPTIMSMLCSPIFASELLTDDAIMARS